MGISLDEASELCGRLESMPGALGGMDTIKGAALVSIAISLKRIADALQPTNESGMNTISEDLFGIMMNGRM